MPVNKTVQFKFSKGELDPELAGRSDLAAYFSSAEELTNWWVISQGGVTRRPGTNYLDEVQPVITQYAAGSITATDPSTNNTNSGTELPYLKNDSIDDGNLYTTTVGISTTDPYIVFQYDLGSLQDVRFFDLFKVKLSANTSTEFQVQKSDDGAAWSALSSPLQTDHTIYLDTTERYYRFYVNDNIRYLRLARVGSTDLTTTVISLIEAQVWL